MNVIEWVGAVAGILGTMLLALNINRAWEGFACYLISNVAWIAVAVKMESGPMLAMNACYLGFTLVGLHRNRRGNSASSQSRQLT